MDVQQILGPAGATAALLFFIIGGLRQWWVFGFHYQEVLRDRDYWKQAALQGLRMSNEAISLAEGRKKTSEGME